jgi:hypothetical protein
MPRGLKQHVLAIDDREPPPASAAPDPAPAEPAPKDIAPAEPASS